MRRLPLSHRYVLSTLPHSIHYIELEDTETTVFNFISTMYQSTGDLMFTSPAAHVPVQARKEPLGNVE
jgi:hypothetical protein